MSTIKVIYIICIIIVTLWTLYSFADNEQQNILEIMRIKEIENKMKIKLDTKNYYRFNTTPCHITNLRTPADCYIGSTNQCKWNVEADRCNEYDNI